VSTAEDNRIEVARQRIAEAARNNLSTLDLSQLGLTAIPEPIGQLTSLTILNLSINRLTSLPESIGQLTGLSTLLLNHTELTELPESIGQLASLAWINLSKSRLTGLPESIGQLTALTRLDLDDNRLTGLPESIGQLTSLRFLDLSDNSLTAVPESIGQLTSLTGLRLRHNELTAVPESIGQLTALTELGLDDNRLTGLPESIGQLTGLVILRLRHNELTAVPESIGQLTSLSLLDLSNNSLTGLPESIGQLTGLNWLDLDGNPDLASPPPEVRAQGVQAVLTFLRARAEAAIELWQSKILIVGEATVGKTSLAKQLHGEPFDPDERQTHGVRILSLPLAHPSRPGVVMALDVWDFGGQLEYRATQRFYLTDRSLFVLVWNARARWIDGKVTAWLDAMIARAPASPILIVATHGDESSPATLPADLIDRYPRIVAVHTIDSRTGSGIEELRRAIADHAATLPLMGMRWPAAWDKAAQAVRGLRGSTATAHAVFTAMADAGVADPDTQQTIARVMHDLGQIAYFADRPDLSTKVILHPQWLDERISQVIDSRAVTDAGGVLSRAERHRLWDDLATAEDDPDLPDRLIQMMEDFDLAYRVGDSERSLDVALIVDRLPEAPPPEADQTWREQAAQPGRREIGIIYKLASRQAGIPTWFIAREHRYTTGLHWRGGVLLHDRDPDIPAWALVTDDGREQPTITMRVVGAYPVRFLSVLTEAFDNIIEDRYPGLIEQRLIPCACQDAAGGHCSHAFALKALLAEATATEPDADHKVRCPESGRKIDAAIMLDGLRGTGLVAELDAIHQQMAHMASTLPQIDARLQAIHNAMRTLVADRANAGVHCPALFGIAPAGHTRWLHHKQLTLTLWCEWPSAPHPVDGDGRYTLAEAPPALLGYLPYLRYLIIALGLVNPALATAGIALSGRVTAAIDTAAKTLEFIDTINGAKAGRDFGPVSELRTVRAESGADFRALLALLDRLDGEHRWGGLSPVNRPEDNRIIYLCPQHFREFAYPYTATTPPP
jgi:internalin A